jgi:hypothetical protein
MSANLSVPILCKDHARLPHQQIAQDFKHLKKDHPGTRNIIPSFLGNKVPLLGKDLPKHDTPKIRRGMPMLRDNGQGQSRKGNKQTGANVI